MSTATTTLLEREEALGALEDALGSALGGEGRIALVSGEAGIGKTSVVRHFTQLSRGSVRTLWGACDALFTPRPFGPFYDIARETGSAVLRSLAETDRTELFASLLDEVGTTRRSSSSRMPTGATRRRWTRSSTSRAVSTGPRVSSRLPTARTRSGRRAAIRSSSPRCSPRDGTGCPRRCATRSSEPETAAELWTARGCPYEAARALAESGDAEALHDAYRGFEGLGAVPATKVVPPTPPHSGLPVPRGHRPSTKEDPANLTARELEGSDSPAASATPRSPSGSSSRDGPSTITWQRSCASLALTLGAKRRQKPPGSACSRAASRSGRVLRPGRCRSIMAS